MIHVIGESSLQVRKVETERLSRWLQGLQYDDCNLCLEKWPRNSSAPGYGMVAGSGGVKKGDVIVRVPEKAFMTEQVLCRRQVKPLRPYCAYCMTWPDGCRNGCVDSG